MAHVTFHTAFDQNSFHGIDGYVVSQSSSEYVVSDGYGTITYLGSFTYGGSHGISGTITDIEASVGSARIFSVSDLHYPAEDYAALLGSDIKSIYVELFDHADYFVGSNGNDGILSYDGDDVIAALGGHDTVYAGLGNDDIDAGSGNDIVFGGMGDGEDTVVSGTGHDQVYAGGGNDVVDGGDGDDLIGGGTGHDDLKGGSGNDLIFGAGGNDHVMAGYGHDVIFLGTGNDTVKGGTGDDVIGAGKGADHVIGGAGDDTIFLGRFDWETDIVSSSADNGHDIVYAFEDGIDRLDLRGSGIHSFDEARDAASDDGHGNVVIDLGAGGSITIDGLGLHELDGSDFVF